MSWGFTANGAGMTDALARFEESVDANQYCKPKQQVKNAAHALCKGMEEADVESITTFGRTDGAHYAVAVCVNCCTNSTP